MAIGVCATESATSPDDLPTFRIDPARAFRALAKLQENPDDTAQVFTIIEAFAGQAPLRLLARFRSDPSGVRLLAARPNLLSRLQDRAALERMPRDSLAHAYLAFIDREGITAEGLVQASVEGLSADVTRRSDLAFVRDRLRDSHDLWHTVTGYQGDLVGETALLAFNVAQLNNPGIALIVLTALLRIRQLDFSKLVGRAYFAGLRAAWLPAAPWESLLALPLDDVRDLLRVARAPAYEPVRTFQLVA